MPLFERTGCCLLIFAAGLLVTDGASADDAQVSSKNGVGVSAPSWTGLPGVDGRKHASADLAESSAILVIFYATSCHECEPYAERIGQLTRDFAKRKVASVLINVCREEQDNLEAMKACAEKHRWSAAFLRDESQAIGKAFGASITPEVFVLDGKRRIVYRGAIDDHWNPAKVKREHARIAIEELLAGKPIAQPTSEPFGCDITYEE